MSKLSMDLRSVDVFTIVQADGQETLKTTIVDEKEFKSLQEALSLMEKSEAPVKYLKFNHGGSTYKLYPTEETGEYRVVKQPILN